jgi:hypothetical protein
MSYGPTRKIKGRSLLAWQQMRVAGQREGGRVVTEGAAQLEEVGALAEVERGEGVAERVEAGPWSACLLCERLEDTATEVARVERASDFVGEGEGGRVPGGLGPLFELVAAERRWTDAPSQGLPPNLARTSCCPRRCPGNNLALFE